MLRGLMRPSRQNAPGMADPTTRRVRPVIADEGAGRKRSKCNSKIGTGLAGRLQFVGRISSLASGQRLQFCPDFREFGGQRIGSCLCGLALFVENAADRGDQRRLLELPDQLPYPGR